MEIDLHGDRLIEAFERFVAGYNRVFVKGAATRIKVIHGYGSNGSGGKIKKFLVRFFDENKDKLTYISGETLEGNPGYTIVIQKEKLPDIIDIVSLEIIEFCDTPKTVDKIAGNFRKYGENKIVESLRKLEKNGTLGVEYKGKHKCYKTL